MEYWHRQKIFFPWALVKNYIIYKETHLIKEPLCFHGNEYLGILTKVFIKLVKFGKTKETIHKWPSNNLLFD